MSEDTLKSGMSRRNVLIGMGAAAAAAYAGNTLAASDKHDHSKHKTQNTDMLEAVNDCTSTGERCIAHCLVSFQEGDTELAKCASKVSEMMSICGGFSYLVASNSEYSEEYAAVCKRACKDCEKVCREHEQHKECKECAEACEELVEEISKAYG